MTLIPNAIYDDVGRIKKLGSFFVCARWWKLLEYKERSDKFNMTSPNHCCKVRITYYCIAHINARNPVMEFYHLVALHSLSFPLLVWTATFCLRYLHGCSLFRLVKVKVNLGLSSAQLSATLWRRMEKWSNNITSRSRVLLEKLIVTHLVKKFPAFYGDRRFITVFTRAH